MPNVSCSTLATGARQFVVQLAFETLPAERTFLVLRDETSGAIVPRVARNRHGTDVGTVESDALTQGDVHRAFLLAHTLKGLSAQLAVTCVYRPAAVLCDLLRVGSADRLPQAQEAFFALVAGLEEARSEIERY